MEKLIIAHRGASAQAPENTLAAFQKAIEAGADMAELDVRQTKDRVLIVFHDSVILKNKIKNLTYSEILSLNNQIPMLEQVMELCAGKIKLDIEVKEMGYEEETVNLALKYFNLNEFIISSFKEKVINKVKEVNQQIPTGLIIGNKKIQDNLRALKLILGSRSKKIGTLIINRNVWNYKLHKAIARRHHQIFIWTVDNEQEFEKLLQDKNINGIITNNPKRGIELKTLLSFDR